MGSAQAGAQEAPPRRLDALLGLQSFLCGEAAYQMSLWRNKNSLPGHDRKKRAANYAGRLWINY